MFSFFASVLLLLSTLLNVVQLVNLSQRHHIAIPPLMEAGGTQTVRWDAVNSILPGIEREINNSPTEQQYEDSFRAYCRYTASLLYKERGSFITLCFMPYYARSISSSVVFIILRCEHTLSYQIIWKEKDEQLCETRLKLIAYQQAHNHNANMLMFRGCTFYHVHYLS